MTYDFAEMRGARNYARLIGGLCSGVPMDAYELVELTGLHLRTVQRHIKALRTHKPRLVRIGDWNEDKNGVRTRAAFELGSGPDVKRPRMTEAQKQARYRANKLGKVASIFEHAQQQGATP